MTRDHYEGPERRDASDNNGLLAGIPAWIRAIAIVGIPGAIALWVVWIGSQTLPEMTKEMVAVRAELAHTNQLLTESQQRSENLYRMMQRVCSASARTDEVRSACFDR